MRMRVVAAAFLVLGMGALLAGCKGAPPTISTPPRAQTSCAGGSVTFSVTAAGTAPLSYQWQKDGATIPGAAGASYTINPVAAAHAGSYTVVVANKAGKVTSSPATLTVNAPPTLTSQPAPQTVCVGASALFTVTATGTAPLSYQWKKNGADIAGATTAIYTIPTAKAEHAAAYTVVATNACGSATSQPAALTVGEAPSIVTQPASREVKVGEGATLTVEAIGSAPLAYQWQKDGVEIPGATGPAFTLSAVTAADAGTYTVVIANRCGRVASEPAKLSAAPVASAFSPLTPEPTATGATPATTEPAATGPAPATTTERPATPQEPVPFMTVNGHPLPRTAFDNIRASILSYYTRMYAMFGIDIQVFLTGARGRMFELEIAASALISVATRGLVEAEAARRGVAVSPAAIEAEFEKQYQAMLDSYGITEEFLIGYFAAQGGSLEEFKAEGRASVEEQLLYEAVQEAVVGPIELSVDELRTYFEERKRDYGTEEEIRASHILVETEEEAQAVLDQLTTGADFAALARERSKDTGSAAKGGDLDWFGRGAMVPEFENAAFALQVGETSGIVQSQFGFHVIRVTDRREATMPEFEAVSERVRKDATSALSTERFNAWLSAARKVATVVIADPLLQAMYLKNHDLDRGIAAFETIRAEGKVEEKYLSFILGALYEEKMAAVQSEVEGLKGQLPEGPERDAQITNLEKAVEIARAAALAAYRQALKDLPDDEDVKERIAALEGAGATPR